MKHFLLLAALSTTAFSHNIENTVTRSQYELNTNLDTNNEFCPSSVKVWIDSDPEEHTTAPSRLGFENLDSTGISILTFFGINDSVRSFTSETTANYDRARSDNFDIVMTQENSWLGNTIRLTSGSVYGDDGQGVIIFEDNGDIDAEILVELPNQQVVEVYCSFKRSL